jgi:fructose-specific phosphotransferase system IIA component
MEIIDLFTPECISMNLSSKNKWEAIHELARLLLDSSKINSITEYEQAVTKRENEVSTGVGFGIGIPHGRSSAVNQPAISFGRSGAGIEFDAIDNQPVHLVFLLAIPDSVDDKDYLHTLASLARMIVHEDFRTQLLEAKTKEDLFAILKDQKNEKIRE